MSDISRIETDPPLAEYRRQLRALDRRWQKELQKANKKISEVFVEKVRASYRARHNSSRRVNQIRARASQTWSGIVLGERKAPGLTAQNFGAYATSTDRLGRRMAWLPPRGDPDHHLYTQLGENREEITALHAEMVDEVMAEAFPGGIGAVARRLV